MSSQKLDFECPELSQRTWISPVYKSSTPLVISWLTHTPHCGFFTCLLPLHPYLGLILGFGMQNVTNLFIKLPCKGGNNCCSNYSVRIKKNLKQRLSRITKSTDHNTATTASAPQDKLAFKMLENEGFGLGYEKFLLLVCLAQDIL